MRFYLAPMIRIAILFLLMGLSEQAISQYSCGLTTERSLFFAEHQGADMTSCSSSFFSNGFGWTSTVQSYSQDLGVSRAEVSGHFKLHDRLSFLVAYHQFGNTNYSQNQLGTAVALKLGERCALSSGFCAEHQRFSDIYGHASTFSGTVSLASAWGTHGYFLGSAYFPFLVPNSIYDKKNALLLAYAYRFDRQLLLTMSVRADEAVHFGCSLMYSPATRVQLVVGNLNTGRRLYGQIALKISPRCWIKQTTYVQAAWGNAYEIGLYYAPRS